MISTSDRSLRLELICHVKIGEVELRYALISESLKSLRRSYKVARNLNNVNVRHAPSKMSDPLAK